MASILDYQTNVVLLCELDPGRYIFCASNVDRVLRNVAVHASFVLRSERAARVVEPVRILDGRWVLDASGILAESARRSETDNSLWFRRDPGCLDVTTLDIVVQNTVTMRRQWYSCYKPAVH
jgi:hypothetical protein